MQFKLKQSSKETKREVTFKKPSYKNKEETPNFFNKCNTVYFGNSLTIL